MYSLNYKFSSHEIKIKCNFVAAVWMDYKTFGPLIMTHFLCAPPWGYLPPPHLHTRTDTVVVPLLTRRPATWKFTFTRRIFSWREAELSANAHLLRADSLEMPQ